MKAWKQIALSVAMIAALVSAALAVFGAKTAPGGYFHAFPMIRHGDSDVFHFKGGKVILKTCCGERPLGTYSQTSYGDWVWDFEYDLGTSILRRQLLIQSDLFEARVTDLHEPFEISTYRRRIFEDLPF